jgi:hypothetical protein
MMLLSPRDAARRLRLSTSRVIQLDREGALPALRDSAGRRFFDAEVVERYARARAEPTGKPSRRGRTGARDAERVAVAAVFDEMSDVPNSVRGQSTC